MKRTIVFLLSLAAGIAAFLLITNAVGWHNITDVLRLLSFREIAVLGIATLLGGLVNVARLAYVLGTFGYRVSFGTLFEAWTAGFAINFLTPVALMGGEVVMSGALRSRRADVPLEDNIASVATVRVLHFTAAVLFMIAGLFVFLGQVSGLPAQLSNLLSLGVLALLVALVAFYRRTSQEKSIIGWFLRKLEAGFGIDTERGLSVEKRVLKFCRTSNPQWWRGLALAIAAELWTMVRFGLAIYFLAGFAPDMVSMLIIFAFTRIAYMAALPATLGSLEATQVFVFTTLGIGGGIGSAFSLVARGMELALTVVGLLFLLNIWLVFHKNIWRAVVSGITNGNGSDGNIPRDG